MQFLITLAAALALSLVVSASRPAQRFAIEPVDRTAIVGDTIILPCRVLNKVGTLQWTKDGFGLGSDRDLIGFPRYQMTGNDEEGDFSLQIRNVQLEDDAQFQCQVGAADGIRGIRSRTSIVTVYMPPEAPKIVEGDFMRTTAGTTVELTCESGAGKPPAELTWLDGDGNPVTSGVEYSTQLVNDGKRANAALKWVLQPSREHDGKMFTCRSENPALKQPQKVHIRMEVKYPPDVQLTIDSTHIMEGDDIKFTCAATANPSDVIYKWYKNDEIIVGDIATTLILPKASRVLNGAVIACEVSNSVGTTRATHSLNIHFGPAFRTPLAAVHGAELGQEVRLKCDVEGNPPPEIIWLYETVPRVLSTEADLVIGQMSYAAAGKYFCRASVRGFPEIAEYTQVFIKGPPRVSSAPIQYGVEGEPIKVECVVQSVPPPTKISWSHNSQAIEVDNSLGYELIEEKLPADSAIRNLLVIHKPKRDHFGTYNCSAWNEFGHDFMIITLAKQTAFPMLVTAAAIIGGVVLIVSVTIIVILCTRRKSLNSEADYMSEIKKANNGGGSGVTSTTLTSSTGVIKSNNFHSSGADTGSSGTDSDLKVELRTSSSLSENHGQCWEDSSDRTVTANEIAQVVENIYNYTQQTQEPVFPPNKETQNNNGYIPYVDYSREYLPPQSNSSSQIHLQQHQQHQQHLLQEVAAQQMQHGLPQHASIVLTSNRDSYVDPTGHYGTLTSSHQMQMDPRYASRAYANPYLRSSAAQANNLSLAGQGSQSVSPQHQQPSPMASGLSIYATNPNHQRYITSTAGNQQVKQGTLATHV